MFLLANELARDLLYPEAARRSAVESAAVNLHRKGSGKMANFYCKYCGQRFSSVNNLTAQTCPYHPDGNHKGRHELYEGEEKSQYTCKYCGHKASSIINLTAQTCPRHPNGNHKGKHSPAL